MSTLLAAGRRWMRAQQLAVCHAEVSADNRAARRLYARHGFRTGRALPDYYGPGRDGVRLNRVAPGAYPLKKLNLRILKLR